MWSFKFIVIAFAFGALAACGFEPLYSRKSGVNASAELASIRIQPIEDRVGQRLHNHLLDLFNPRGRPRKPRYTLRVELTESSGNVAVSKESFATRVNYTLSASFTLYEGSTKTVLFGGSDRVVTSYNVLESNYATQIAEENAQKNAVRQVALNIQNQIAARLKIRSAEQRLDRSQIQK